MCGLSRYKVKDGDKENIVEVEKHDPSSKVVGYLPIITRFRHMFANPTNAKNLRWHVGERKCDGLLNHPVDFVHWQNIDKEFSALKKWINEFEGWTSYKWNEVLWKFK